MATQDSIVGGLFATPEQYQQQQYNQALERNIRLAQLNPMQRGLAQLGTSAYQLGGAIGGALGAEDPMLKLQANRRALIQQIDMSNPESLVQGIKASTNDPELSAYLMGKYKELTGIQKEQSVIEKNKNFQQAQADRTQVRNLLADIETRLGNNEPVSPTELNKAKLAYSEKGQPTDHYDPATQTVVRLPGIDMTIFPNLTQAFGKNKTAGSATTTSQVSVLSTPASQEAAQTQAETAKEAVATVQNAINKVDEASKLYSESKTAGGYGQLLAGLPNTDARSLANLTSNIKSAFSVEEIAKLKAQSKTGATGFGSLAVKELETIQNAVTALDPADKNYPNQLKTIRESFDRWKKLMEQRSVRAEARAGGTSPMSGKNPQLQPTEEAWIERAMAKNPKFSRGQVISEGIKAGKLPAGYGQ